MRWTEKDFADHQARRAGDAMTKPRPHAPRQRMNKLEEAYAQHLNLMQQVGVIRWHKFEAIKLRLADRTFFTPDFPVINADGELEFHETKGSFIRDDAAVKLKVAAELYPFWKFFLVRRTRARGWDLEEK